LSPDTVDYLGDPLPRAARFDTGTPASRRYWSELKACGIRTGFNPQVAGRMANKAVACYSARVAQAYMEGHLVKEDLP